MCANRTWREHIIFPRQFSCSKNWLQHKSTVEKTVHCCWRHHSGTAIFVASSVHIMEFLHFKLISVGENVCYMITVVRDEKSKYIVCWGLKYLVTWRDIGLMCVCRCRRMTSPSQNTDRRRNEEQFIRQKGQMKGARQYTHRVTQSVHCILFKCLGKY